MKNNKDIFDLFKDNEHKLHELLPSERTWQRLEDRLDNRRSRRRIKPGLPNWLSMAGVLLVLITMISAISLLFNKTSDKTAMNNNTVSSPQLALEEIGLFSEQSKAAYNIKSYEKQLKRLNTNPFLEGDPSKELRVQKKIFAALRNRSNKQNNNDSSIALVDKIISKKVDNPIIAESQVDGISLANETESEVTAADVAYKAAASANDSKLHEVTDSDQISLDQFQWLIGQWEAPFDKEKTSNSKTRASTPNPTAGKNKDVATSFNSDSSAKHSLEEWHQLNATTIEGKGYVLVNGDTTFTESMHITQIGKDLYYILDMDNKEQARKYLLKTFSPEEIIFENKNLAFPNQVILRPNANNSNFTTLLQNNTPTQLNSEQQKYFQQRNQISTEQIRRVMKRAASNE